MKKNKVSLSNTEEESIDLTLSPKDYFNQLKNKKQKSSDEILNTIYENCLILIDKYQRTNQVEACKKLIFHIDTIEKERQAINLGIDTFIYLNDVKNFVENVQDRVVKIIELERYEREIPEEVIETYEKVKGLFTKFFIVFTDYTSDLVDKTKKERDPILFGMFQSKETSSNSERLYYIGDWEDEYCDLTLDRLVTEMRKGKENVEFTLKDPINLEELREKIKALSEEYQKGSVGNNQTYSANSSDDENMFVEVKKKSFFNKINPFKKK